MINNEYPRNSFPLLTAVGILFTLLLCLFGSAMIAVAVPKTTPLIAMLLNSVEQPIVYSNISAYPTPTPFLPAINQNVQTDSITQTEPSPTPSPQPEPIPVPDDEPVEELDEETGEIPLSASISGVVGSPQHYTLDCEAQAAVDWARFFGVDIDRSKFIERMPKSDDPEEGFVGDVNGPMGQFPPDDYGVHSGPVADLLVEYGLNAKAVRGWDLEQLKKEISSGRPVIVWIVNLPFEIDTMEYTASNGHTTTVARFEHTWIVTGYNMNVLTVIDSEWTYNVKTGNFLKRWAALGNQAIIYKP